MLAGYLNRGPFPIGGDHTTIWATGASYHELIDGTFIGPPYRMIVDLGDLRNSCSSLTPGQSGNPASQHYDDQIGPWFSGEYHPMLYYREDIEKNTKHHLVLLKS